MYSPAAACAQPPSAGDPSCIEPTHKTDKSVTPAVLAYTAPTITACTDVFRPEFRAGTQRLTVTGTGKSLEEATADAVAKFLDTAKCDYVVAVTKVISMNTHPTWRFFATTNYTVTFSGIPIYLDKIVKTEAKKDTDNGSNDSDTGKKIIKLLEEALKKLDNLKNTPPPPPPDPNKQSLGFLKLTDIDVQIKAKGETADKAGVAFPAK